MLQLLRTSDAYLQFIHMIVVGCYYNLQFKIVHKIHKKLIDFTITADITNLQSWDYVQIKACTMVMSSGLFWGMMTQCSSRRISSKPQQSMIGRGGLHWWLIGECGTEFLEFIWDDFWRCHVCYQLSIGQGRVLSKVLDSCLLRYGHLYGSDARSSHAWRSSVLG